MKKIFYDLRRQVAYDANQVLIANSNLPIFTFTVNEDVYLQLLNTDSVDDNGVFDDYYTFPSGVGACFSVDNNYVKYSELTLNENVSGTMDRVQIKTTLKPREIGSITFTNDNLETETVNYNGYTVDTDYITLFLADSQYNRTPYTFTYTYLEGDKSDVSNYPLFKDESGDIENNDGLIKFDANLTNVVLLKEIINSPNISGCLFEFHIKDANGDNIIIESFPVYVRGTVDCYNSGTAPVIPAGSYYTKAEIDALLNDQNEFIELNDTPNSYATFENYMVVVNSTGDGLEFIPNVGTDEYVKVDSTSTSGKYLIDAVPSGQFGYDAVLDQLYIKNMSIDNDLISGGIDYTKLTIVPDMDTIQVNASGEYFVDHLYDMYITGDMKDTLMSNTVLNDLNDVYTPSPFTKDLLQYDGEFGVWENVNPEDVLSENLTKGMVETVLTGTINSHNHDFQLENGISDNINDFDCSDACKVVGVKFDFDETKLPQDCLALYHFNTCEKETKNITNNESVIGWTANSNWDATYGGSNDAYYETSGVFNTYIDVPAGGGVTVVDTSELSGADFSIDGYAKQQSNYRTFFNLFNGNLFAYTWLYDQGPEEDWCTHAKIEVTLDDDSNFILDYILYYNPDNEFTHFGMQIQNDFMYVLYDKKILDKIPLEGRHIKYESGGTELIIGEESSVDELMICKTGRFNLENCSDTYEIPEPEWYKMYYGVLEDCGHEVDVPPNPLTPGWNRLDNDSLGNIVLDKPTRELKIEPISAVGSFYYYDKNHEKHIIDVPKTITIPDDTGIYYVAFNEFEDLILINGVDVTMSTFAEYPLVASVIRYKDSDILEYIPEQHSWDENYTHHAQVHFTDGTRYSYGLRYEFDPNTSLTEYTKVTKGSIWDEDIKHPISEHNQMPFIYRLGANGEWYVSDQYGDNLFAYKESGNTYASWNRYNDTTGEWELVEGTSTTDYWWTFTICIPFANSVQLFKIIGQNTYSSRNDAKAQAGEELRNILLSGLPNNEYIITEAYLVKRDGKIQIDEDGHYFTPIYSHSITKNAAGGGESGECYYRQTVTTTSDYTLPDDWNGGDVIKVTMYDTVGGIVRPPAGMKIIGTISQSGKLKSGLGLQCSQMGRFASIDLKFDDNLNAWVVKDWSGYWTIEGATMWLPLDDATLHNVAGNSQETKIQENLFNQDMRGASALYTYQDTPYGIYSGLHYGYQTFYTKISRFCLHSADQYGVIKNDECLGANPFYNTNNEALIDVWVKRDNTSGSYYQVIASAGELFHRNSWELSFNTNDQLSLTIFDDGGNASTLLNGTTQVTDNTDWHRVTIALYNNTLAIYLDGYNEARVTFNTATNEYTAGKFRMCADLNDGYPFYGKIKDFVLAHKLLYDVNPADSNDVLPDWVNPPYWLQLTTEGN